LKDFAALSLARDLLMNALVEASVMRKAIPLLLLGAVAGCGSSSGGDDVLKNIDSLVILQRTPRMGGVGDVFQYTSYVPGAKLTKLSPPTADGKRTNLCCAQFGAEWEKIDIMSYDISFDAKSIVMSARLGEGDRYGLYVLTLNDAGEAAGPPVAIKTGSMRDYVYPIFANQERIVFVTNEVVEAGAKQHRDEYERGETTQLGSISIDGSNEVLGPRNLSHRVAPTMLHTGQVLFTQWDHLGDENSGHLMLVSPDMTNLREAFGKEGTGRTNSYLKAVEFPVNETEFQSAEVRVAVIGTSRDRTLQSGKVLDVRLGKMDQEGVYRQSEANASFIDHTPLVPAGREPSQPTIGRYYDAYPVRADDGAAYADKPFMVVSWADGPVEQETLAAAGVAADFGIYLYDTKSGARRPIFNDPATWDVLARPLKSRPAPRDIPAAGSNGFSTTSALIGSLNVYDSSLDDIPSGSVVKVRVLEGFSVEEGVPDDFGLTEHEGAALLGEATVHEDGSWAALVPANVPLHLQAIDKFGMAIVNEPVWFSARPGESRFCGGCHEDRARTTVIQPGLPQAVAMGPVNMDKPRAQRVSYDYSRGKIVGVPWEDEGGAAQKSAIQNIFTAKCAGCHNGVPGPANPSIVLTDTVTGMTSTITFDLRGGPVSYGIGAETMTGYSRSHLSIMGPDIMKLERDSGLSIEVSGNMKIYCEPGSARTSELFKKLNPPQLYPYDPSKRMIPDQPSHLSAVGRPDLELSEDEAYALILMCDAGGQFYARENVPGAP
jgi:hypothetical protein